MTTTASVQFRTEFESLVKHAYQGSTKLMGTVRTRNNAMARTVSFPKLGKGVASLRIPGANVTPMNATHTAATCTILDYDASDYSYVEDLDKISFDEKMELVKVSSNAVGRGLDQVVIDAMAASAFATQVAITEGGANTSLNIEKFTKASALLNANGVPEQGRYLAVTADALMAALRETEVGSSDYNQVQALVSGTLNTFMGFKIIMIETRTAEGGLPLATANQRNCFAWHQDAVGLAMNGGIKTNVDWIPEKKSWLISSSFAAGAVTIDTDGVIDVLCYEA
jgi:hypothetical protein